MKLLEKIYEFLFAPVGYRIINITDHRFYIDTGLDGIKWINSPTINIQNKYERIRVSTRLDRYWLINLWRDKICIYLKK